jgi:hypothetical protein
MSTELQKRPSAAVQLASSIGVSADMMVSTIKAQCFKNINPANVTNEQMAVFTNTAHHLGLNPLVPGMLEAFPTRNGGVAIIIGPDGVFKLLSDHPDIEGWTTDFDHDEKGKVRSCTVTITRRGRGAVSKTCFLDEWYIDSNPNWRARPRHMLELRTIKQAARYVIHGIPLDADEAVIAEFTAQAVGDSFAATPPSNKAEASQQKTNRLLDKIAPKTEPVEEPVEAEIVEEKPAPVEKAARKPRTKKEEKVEAPVEQKEEPPAEPLIDDSDAPTVEPDPAPVELGEEPIGGPKKDNGEIDKMVDEFDVHYLVQWVNAHISAEAERRGSTISETGREILVVIYDQVRFRSPKPLADWFLEGDERRAHALRQLVKELAHGSEHFLGDEPIN